MPRLERGVGVSELALELARSPEFAVAPWGEWSGPERMVITLTTIDRHRRGVAGAVSEAERARIFAGVAGVARQLGWRPDA